MVKIVKYKTISGRCPIDEFVKQLLNQNKETELMQINLYIQQLEEYGYDLPHKSRFYAKSLGDGLYELRPGPNRIIYFFHKTGQEYVLLHAFEKTT